MHFHLLMCFYRTGHAVGFRGECAAHGFSHVAGKVHFARSSKEPSKASSRMSPGGSAPDSARGRVDSVGRVWESGLVGGRRFGGGGGFFSGAWAWGFCWFLRGFLCFPDLSLQKRSKEGVSFLISDLANAWKGLLCTLQLTTWFIA